VTRTGRAPGPGPGARRRAIPVAAMKKVLIVFVNAVYGLTRASGRVFSTLSFLLLLLILVDVVTRYLPFFRPLAISDEFGGYLLVAITMLGLAFAWQEKSHVRVEFLLDYLKPKIAELLTKITTAIAFMFTLVITYAAWQHIKLAFMFKVRSNTWVRTVIAYPQLSIICGLALLDLFLLARLIDTLFLKNGCRGDGKADNGAVK
jgi:TRAP-type C4-dicarboxylate transport system permease small subunit